MKAIDIILEKKLVNKVEIAEAKKESKKTGLSLEESLVRLGFITEEDIARAIADKLNVPFMDLKRYVIDPNVIKLIPEKVAKRFKLMPLFKVGDSITVAMKNPQDILAIDEVRMKSGLSVVEPVLALDKDIDDAIEKSYGVGGTVAEMIQGMPKPEGDEEGNLGVETLTRIAEEAPVVKLVNLLISQAVKEGASDIHIEPGENELRVRYRIDGVLHEAVMPPKHLQNAVISRIKILAQLDIAEKRRAQDGRIITKIEDKNIDLRVSTFPTVHGENIVLRILDKSSAIKKLTDIGMSPDWLKTYADLIKRPHGIIDLPPLVVPTTLRD